MLRNPRVTAFAISELLQENQKGAREEGVGFFIKNENLNYVY